MSTSKGNNPEINLLLQYLKDLSVENPTPLMFLQAKEDEVETGLDFNVEPQALGESQYEVVLTLRLNLSKEDKPFYVVDCQFAGIFSIENVENEEMLPAFLFVQCPYLLFPYVRALITRITQESGFPPLNLQPIDFLALFQQKVEEFQKQKGSPLIVP